MALTLAAFRFGSNDGTESTHGWLAAQDTNVDLGRDSIFLLRFLVQATGGVAHNDVDFQFQYRLNGGSWTDITTTSTVVKAVGVNALGNGGNASNRLTGGTGTFESTQAGVTEDGSSGGTSCDIVANGFTETVCSLQIVTGDVADEDQIEFRLLQEGTTFDTYAVTPKATVQVSDITVTAPLGTTAFGAASNTVTSGSFTPAANALLIVGGSSFLGTSLPGAIAVSDSAGLTWTEIDSDSGDNASTVYGRAAAFWARVGSSPAAMTVTVSSSSATRVMGGVAELSALASSSIVNTASNVNASGDPASTLGTAPATNSVGISLFGGLRTTTASVPSAVLSTTLATGTAVGASLFIECSTSGPPTSVAYSTGNTIGIGIYFEVVEGAGTGTVTLDTGSISVAGSDLLAPVAVTLDTGAVTVAGSDLTITNATTVTLDTGAVTAAGADLSAATAVTLDTGSAAVAGVDLPFSVLVALDTGAIAVAGADALASLSLTLDTGGVTVAGNDLTIGEAGTVVLDTGAVALAGADLSAAVSVLLDTGSVAAAGADLSPNVAVTLDTGAVAVAGEDLIVAPANTVSLDTGAVAVAGTDLAANQNVTLDTGAVAVAGNDLTPTASNTVALDTGSVAVAGADLSAPTVVTLDSGSITVAASDLAAMCSLLLDAGTITIAGSDISILSTEVTIGRVRGSDSAAYRLAGADSLVNRISANDQAAYRVTGTDS